MLKKFIKEIISNIYNYLIQNWFQTKNLTSIKKRGFVYKIEQELFYLSNSQSVHHSFIYNWHCSKIDKNIPFIYISIFFSN